MKVTAKKIPLWTILLLSALAVLFASGCESPAKASARHINACTKFLDDDLLTGQLVGSDSPSLTQEHGSIHATWKITNDGATPGKACIIISRMEAGLLVGVESSVVKVAAGSDIEAKIAHDLPDLAPIIWTYNIELRDGADNGLMMEHSFTVNMK
jgi:hypothetical protein